MCPNRPSAPWPHGFAWQGTMAYVVYQVVRSVYKGEVDAADAIARPHLLPYPALGGTRSIKIISSDVKGPWDENHKFTLRHKCDELWPLWVLVTLMLAGHIRIDGRLVFQDKEAYGSAWIVIFKLLGQWNKGIGQSQIAKEYIYDNLADVLKCAFISPEEANDKQAFAACTSPLNLPKPCTPLPPPGVLCFDVFP